ncbi:MAG: helix-turn-helix domain-containing protein [Prevotella sp.]|nr:helix-turn-helix domain-containing protein [Prevotella sp.]
MRLRNNIFAEAFKWLKKNWDGIRYQKDLAAKIGVSEDTITRIMRDQTEVTDDFLCKFNEAFDNVFNYQWLRGEDPLHMLTVDLIEAEPYIDPSSQTNATISAYIEAIESLKRELRTKDDLLAEKDARLAEKDERIAELKAHNIDLRHQLDQYQNANVDRYPFPVGAADGNKRQSKRK